MVFDKEKNINSSLKFPKSVFIIIAFVYCVRYAYTSTRSALPFFFTDVLHIEESQATLLYHTFGVLAFFFALIGGIVADSWFGLFKSIFYFNICHLFGLTLFSAISVTFFNLPVREFAILAIFSVALGHGTMRACIPTFGGYQFTLPEQKKQLSLFFVLYCIINNVASISSSFVMPILRKDLKCFGELTCYPLAFIVPAALLALGIVMIVVTKKMFQIRKPESNVIVDIIKCVFHALHRKVKSNVKRQHWLDFADDKYESKLIEDIKSVLQIIRLFIPLPVFWSLYGMQSSTWTFQARRMTGEVGDYVITPDQIQVVNPLFVIIAIPIFHSYIYPMLGKFCFLNTPLRKITVGGLLAALSFAFSAFLEINLESTYAVTPVKGFAQLRIFNTLDCDVFMTIDGQNVTVEELNMWKNITIPVKNQKFLEYKANFNGCEIFNDSSKIISGSIDVLENEATSWVITTQGLNYRYKDSVDKSLNAYPLVRALIYVDQNYSEEQPVLNLKSNGIILKEISLSKNFKESDFKTVDHKNYDMYINNQLVEPSVPLKLGGVYTVVGYISNKKSTVHTVTVTEPNSIHILWVLPQQLTMSISEIMVDVLVAEFAFSESPVSMKTLTQSCWLLTGFFGNLLVIAITAAQFFDRKVYELILFAVLMTISMIIFAILSMFYNYKQNESHNSIDLTNDLQNEDPTARTSVLSISDSYKEK